MAKKKGESCLSILFKITLLLTLLLTIIIGGVFFAYQKLNEFFNRGATVVVPDFRGKHIVEVFKTKPDGLIIVRRDEKFDDTCPKDHVIAQYPEPGTVVRENKKVQLSISLGTQKVQVPDVANNSLREVELALLNSQLKVGNKSYIHSDKIVHDKVVAQSPLAATEYGVGKKVDLLVSLGKKSISLPLPDLTGTTLDEAREKIRAWGFNSGRIYSRKDPSKPKFQVISSSPSPYSEVRKGDVVSLLISSGNDKGTATWKDLRKFEIYSGATASKVEASEDSSDSPAVVSPPRILIAEDGNVNAPVEPVEKPENNVLSNEKEISFVMPDGFMPKEVKFIYISSQGRKQVYAGTHKPLDLVKVKVPAISGGKVQIYINDVPIEERSVEP